MSQLYSTGPALFYVGIPYQWTAVIDLIFRLQYPPSQTSLLFPSQTVGLEAGGHPGGPAPPPWSGGPVGTNTIQSAPLGPPSRFLTFVPPNPRSFLVQIEQLQTSYIPVFLGTSESPPEIEIIPSWDVVETDTGGTEQPSDRLSEGEEAVIRADLTRFNEGVYLALAGRSQPNAFLGGFPGWGQIGKAMYLERLTLPLWISFPYTGKLVYELAGQPAGYRFYNTLVIGPDQLRQLGSRERLTHLEFRAQRLMQLIEDAALLVQPYDNYQDIPLPNPPLLPTGIVDPNDLDNSVGGLYDFDLTGLPGPD